MTTIMILVALAALILFSAGAAEGPYPVPRLGWHQWFFLFLSSSFLGCLFEMEVVWLGTGVLMSRSSLLYGAVSVVWGLGALLMLLILYPLRRYGPGTVFAGGMILGGGFEYLASLLLAVDMALSAAAFLRMEERSQGESPSNQVERLLDTWYDDGTMQRRYQNMTLPQ